MCSLIIILQYVSWIVTVIVWSMSLLIFTLILSLSVFINYFDNIYLLMIELKFSNSTLYKLHIYV